MPSLTEDFCAVLLRAARGPLPPPVERAARRTLLNVLGTAVAAAGSAAVGVLLAAADEAGSAGDVTVPGLTRTLDPYWGALATGTAAHLDDFDDTHLATVIHPGASTLATVLSLVPEAAPAGGAFLGAFAAGCEAQLRIGCAISPAHYDHGWHITGTCGVFGAAVAASALLGLDADATARALSLAATMTAGHREAFGTMTKPLHAGKAAANGVLAARLAAAGLSGPADPLGDGGVLEVLAASVDREALGLGWPEGHRWELELNTIKTYPCGVVAHPAMDAAVIAHARLAELAVPGEAEITGITLRCNPLVPELMGREQPADGLESRFSARHGVAVCLLYGRGGLAEFSDAVATAPEVARLRSLITLDADPAVPRDAAVLLVARGPAGPRPGAAGVPATGVPAIEVAVEHTRGSAALPLTDDEVHAKVRALFGPVLGEAAADRARDAVDKLPGAQDTSELLAALRPQAAPGKPHPVPSGLPGPATVLRSARPAREGRQGTVTSTGEILALAASLLPAAAASAGTEAVAAAAEVTEADLAAFGEAAALGAGSDVVRVLRAMRPGPSPAAAPSGGPAWTAWLTAAAAVFTAGGSSGNPESQGTWPVHPAWIAVFAAGTALSGGPQAVPAGVTVRSAIAAGMSSAAIVESGLADWGGWSSGAVAGAVGASVTAGLLLRLTEAQLRAAVGISATQASGLAVARATPASALQVGKAAFNGVEAALLARAGLTAPDEPLDGRRGLFALFG